MESFPDAKFLGGISELSRNNSFLYLVGGEKVVLKRFQKPIFFRREAFLYDLLNRLELVKTPEMFYGQDLELATRFIGSEKEKDIGLASEDWAKIHSYFISNLQIKNNNLLMKHDLLKNSEYLLANFDVFKRSKRNLLKILDNITPSKIKTLISGDLCAKNILTRQKMNYYLDFEFSGIGSPAKDLASLILHHPDKKEEIMECYKGNITFKYPFLDKEVREELVVRGLQLIYILDKKDINGDLKQVMQDKFWNVILDYL